MFARWPNAFLLSAILHATAAALALWLGYEMVEQTRPAEIMQLVTFGGRSVAMAASPASPHLSVHIAPPPPHAAVIEAPSTEEEAASVAVESPRHVVRTPAIRPIVPKAQGTAPSPVAGVSGPTSLSDFRKRHPAAGSTPPRVASSHVAQARPRVDGETVAEDLRRSGSAAIAAVGDGDSSTADYIQRLEAALGAELERIGGFPDGIRTEVEFHILSDGRLTRARLIRGSGDERFDAAVLRIIDSFQATPRPSDIPEVRQSSFVTRARN